MQLNKISSFQPVMNGVMVMRFADGYEGIVDFRPQISQGGTWEFLKDKNIFSKAFLSDDKRVLEWQDDAGHSMDACADALREKAECAEEVLRAVG